MSKKSKIIFGLIVAVAILLLAGWYISTHNVAVLSPQGTIAQKEKSLITFTALLSLVVVVPVFIMTFTIAWKYREGNHKAQYKPDWDHNSAIEAVWWLIPTLLILLLAGVTWRSSHELDPFKPIYADAKPMTIQVVALDWKWLFIYPDQKIASVNYVRFPQQTPINFEITADAPMNSFWIPQLGGQIYAMTGMSTHLHLMADGQGTYRGSSANLSGRGFAGMDFLAQSTTSGEFNSWVKQVKKSGHPLDQKTYAVLALPSQNNQPTTYSSASPNLYDTIVMKYMLPGAQSQNLNSDGYKP